MSTEEFNLLSLIGKTISNIELKKNGIIINFSNFEKIHIYPSQPYAKYIFYSLGKNSPNFPFLLDNVEILEPIYSSLYKKFTQVYCFDSRIKNIDSFYLIIKWELSCSEETEKNYSKISKLIWNIWKGSE